MCRFTMGVLIASLGLTAAATPRPRFEGAFNEGRSRRECVTGLAETLASNSALGHLSVTNVTTSRFGSIFEFRAVDDGNGGKNEFSGVFRVRVEPQYNRRTGRRLGYVCSVRTNCERVRSSSASRPNFTEYKLFNSTGEVVDSDATIFCGRR